MRTGYWNDVLSFLEDQNGTVEDRSVPPIFHEEWPVIRPEPCHTPRRSCRGSVIPGIGLTKEDVTRLIAEYAWQKRYAVRTP